MQLRNLTILLILCFLVTVGFVPMFSNEGVGDSGNEIYVDSSYYGYYGISDGSAEKPYDSIQYAIDVAEDGDTIYVFGGMYDESLVIDKQIKLWGGEGGESIIDYKFDKRYTVEITADHAELLDFTVSDSGNHKTSHIGALICIKSDNVVVQGNHIKDTSSWGIYVDSTASGSVVSGNIIENATVGIFVDSSGTNDILDNEVTDCSEYALQITSSSNNRLYENYLSDGGHGIYVQDCSSINISDNTIEYMNYYGIYLDHSSGVVKGNEIISNEDDGIYLKYSFNCEIFENVLDDNQRGITLIGSNNEIRDNDLFNSRGTGIYAYSGSEGNIIYLNRFEDNTRTAQDDGNNQWFYENQGNYWSDYNNIDRNLDGIGDVPYKLPDGNKQDKYPLGYFFKPPKKPSDPSPEDTEDGVGLKITLKVKVEDKDSDKLTVYFYNAKTGDLINIDKNVKSGYKAECSFTLAFNTTFAWYAIVNDSLLENKSDPWFFTTKTIPPDNEPPTSDAGGPYSAGAGQTITFDGSNSYDPDGNIDFYRWNFGDETSEILAESPDHVYSSSGIYEVTLTVIDNDGTTNTDIISVNIGNANQKPTANPGGPYLGNVSKLVNFDGSGSYDSDGTVANYTWTFGDNMTGYGIVTTHRYSKAGTYSVRLTVTDDKGDIDAESTIITIKELSNGLPGFELFYIIFAAAIVLIWRRKKNNKKSNPK